VVLRVAASSILEWLVGWHRRGVSRGRPAGDTRRDCATIVTQLARTQNDRPVAAPAAPLSLVYLNAPDVAALQLTDDEILQAVESGLRAQGEGRTVIEPRSAPGARPRRGRRADSRALSTCCAVMSHRSRWRA
jgi:hypothetical protein